MTAKRAQTFKRHGVQMGFEGSIGVFWVEKRAGEDDAERRKSTWKAQRQERAW